MVPEAPSGGRHARCSALAVFVGRVCWLTSRSLPLLPSSAAFCRGTDCHWSRGHTRLLSAIGLGRPSLGPGHSQGTH